jgi:protein phosphatase
VDRPDVRLRDVQAGDRYLLCSDGLTSVVGEEDVRGTVAGAAGPEAAVRELVDLALRAGAPDNVSCVVADVTGAADVTGKTEVTEVTDVADKSAGGAE